METQIIDFHTHIYPVALARRAMEVVRREGDPYDSLPIRENLLRRMEEADISLSVVQPVVSRPETQTDVNRFAREIVRTNLISFGGLHPDCPHVLEEIEKLKDLHMAGVKFHPPFQKVHSGGRKIQGNMGEDQSSGPSGADPLRLCQGPQPL